MPRSILIAGAGQLGSRYLQGLAPVSAPLFIVVYDVSAESLRRAEARWHEVPSQGGLKQVVFSQTLEVVPEVVDVAVVATVADARPQVVEAISGATTVRYWVLEKVLAQSEKGIATIEAVARQAEGSWVNTPRRLMPWHQEVRAHLCEMHPIAIRVTGGSWGLVCNAVHFLDLLQWWTGAGLEQLDFSGLESTWIEGKRPGYWEAFGTLVASYSDGSVARLSVGGGDESISFSARVGRFEWIIDEAAGKAVRDDGLTVDGRVNLQSELTTEVVEGLLARGTCGLPTLTDAAPLHRMYIRGLLDHWNKHMAGPVAALPIT